MNDTSNHFICNRLCWPAEAEELCVLSCFVYYFEHIQQHYSYNRLLSSLQAMLCARANA